MNIETHEVGESTFGLCERGRGLPLLLIHGFPLDHTMWEAQVESLAGQCHVLAPDLRGFGASGPAAEKVTMRQYADDLAALLDAREVREPVVVCGLSMGGYVAWQFWKHYAQRVRAMVLCDTRAKPDPPEGAAARLETADRVMREGAAVLVDGMLPKLLAPQTLAGRADLVQEVRDMIQRADAQGVAGALRGMAQREDATGMLGSIACPALLLVGRHDAISTPEEMRTIAAAMPDARMVEIADAGHMSPMENPSAFNAALAEFLAGLG